MLKQLPLILTEGRITQLCHPWVLQKSAHLWPEIIFLNQNKMSSPCRAITVNVRERYVGTRQRGKTSDKAFRQQHRQCCHKTAVHLAQHRTRQTQTTGCFFMATNVYVSAGKVVGCLTMLCPIMWFLIDFEQLITYTESSFMDEYYTGISK